MRRSSLLASAVLFSVCAFANGAPLKSGPEAYTAKQFNKEYAQYLRQRLGETYLKHGKRSPRWDAMAAVLLEGFVQVQTAEAPTFSYDKLIELGAQAHRIGCDDPLVLYVYASALADKKNHAAAVGIAEQSVQNLHQTTYPAWVRLMTTGRTFGECRWTERWAQAKQYENEYSQYLVDCLTDGSIGRDQARCLWTSVAGFFASLDGEQQRLIAESCLSDRRVDRWLATLISGEYYVAEAWRKRGSGWAVHVKQSGWAGFQENIVEAKKQLTAAHELEPRFPEPATRMIAVSRAVGDPPEEMRRWFDLATAAQFDFSEAYAKYRFYNLPRWGGSHEFIYDFALECVRTGRYDTNVPWQLAETLSEIRDDLHGSFAFYSRPGGVFDELEKVVRGYIKQYPERTKPNAEYLTQLLAIAFQIGRYEIARRLLDEMNGSADARELSKSNLILAQVVATVYAETSPYRTKMREAANAIAKSGDLDAAVKIYEAIIAENQDPRATPFFTDRRDNLKTQLQFLTGEWTTPPINELMLGWKPVHGSLRSENGVIVATSTDDRCVAFSPLVVGTRFEAEVRFRRSPDPETEYPIIAMGSPGPEHFKWLTAAWSPYWHSLSVMPQFDASFEFKKRIDDNSPTTLRMKVWDGEMTILVGDEVAIGKMPAKFADDDLIMFGIGSQYAQLGVETRFESIRLRKLSEQPKSPEIDSAFLLMALYHWTNEGGVDHSVKQLKKSPLLNDPLVGPKMRYVLRSLENRARYKPGSKVNLIELAADPANRFDLSKGWSVENGVLVCTAEAGVNETWLAFDLDSYNLVARTEWDPKSPPPLIEFDLGKRPGQHYWAFRQQPDMSVMYRFYLPTNGPWGRFAHPASDPFLDIQFHRVGSVLTTTVPNRMDKVFAKVKHVPGPLTLRVTEAPPGSKIRFPKLDLEVLDPPTE